MIIGIVGTLGAGKGTIVDHLKQKGFAHYSVSSILKETLTERGQPLTRDHLSSLAEELMAKYKGGTLGLALERAKKNKEENFILEAIHRMSEADFVRSVGGKILGVDADIKVRYERTVARKDGEKDSVTFEQFSEHVKREEEGQRALTSNIKAVIQSADAVVMNNGTKEELVAAVDQALEKLRS